jgi:hypothetical protein
MKQTFENHLQKIKTFLENQPNIQVLKLKYDQVVTDPQTTVEKIINFLNLSSSLAQEMASIVNPSLYRNKLN